MSIITLSQLRRFVENRIKPQQMFICDDFTAYKYKTVESRTPSFICDNYIYLNINTDSHNAIVVISRGNKLFDSVSKTIDMRGFKESSISVADIINLSESMELGHIKINTDVIIHRSEMERDIMEIKGRRMIICSKEKQLMLEIFPSDLYDEFAKLVRDCKDMICE